MGKIENQNLLIVLIALIELHIKTATEARERYREEKNWEWTGNSKVVSVDMQKVMMLRDFLD